MIAEPKPRQQPPPPVKPQRRVHWLWRNETHGYGILVLEILTPKGWTRQDYFAQPDTGRKSKCYTLSKLVAGVGIEKEYIVDLTGATCDCDHYKNTRQNCQHLSALGYLDHHGRL